jgi:hypothetical protein
MNLWSPQNCLTGNLFNASVVNYKYQEVIMKTSKFVSTILIAGSALMVVSAYADDSVDLYGASRIDPIAHSNVSRAQVESSTLMAAKMGVLSRNEARNYGEGRQFVVMSDLTRAEVEAEAAEANKELLGHPMYQQWLYRN